MSAVAIVSTVTVLVTCIVVGWLVIRHPMTLVKPSVVVSLGLVVQVGLGQALTVGWWAEFLDEPWKAVVVLQVLPLLILAVAPWTFRGSMEAVYLQCRTFRATYEEAGAVLRLVGVGFALLTVLLIVYLLLVPFTGTGLYALLTEPTLLGIRRQESAGSGSGLVPGYLIAISQKALAPFLIALCVVLLVSIRQTTKPVWSLVLAGAAMLIAGIWTVLGGSRGPSALVVLSGIYLAWLLTARNTRRFIVLLGVVGVLLGPVLVTSVKNDRLGMRGVIAESVNVADRITGRSFVDNIWYLHWLEQRGYVGLAGVPKLAALVGTQPIDLGLEIGSHYQLKGYGIEVLGALSERLEPSEPVGASPSEAGNRDQVSELADRVQETRFAPKATTANPPIEQNSGASFMASSYAIFGSLGVLLAGVFVFGLDLLLLLYRRLTPIVMLGLVGAMVVPFASLSFSSIHTSLLSKGLVIIPLMAVALNSVALRRKERKPGKCFR